MTRRHRELGFQRVPLRHTAASTLGEDMGFTPLPISPTSILCRGSGNVDYNTFLVLFEDLSCLKGTLKGVGILCDVSGCTSTLNFQEELRVFDYVGEHVQFFAGSKWAFLTDSLLLYGLARIGDALAAHLPVEYAVFREAEAAKSWLGWVAVPSSAIVIRQGATDRSN